RTPLPSRSYPRVLSARPCGSIRAAVWHRVESASWPDTAWEVVQGIARTARAAPTGRGLPLAPDHRRSTGVPAARRRLRRPTQMERRLDPSRVLIRVAKSVKVPAGSGAG